MNRKFNRLAICWGLAFFLVPPLPAEGCEQNIQQSNPVKRAKVCFDFNCQFHKSDITIKRQVKVGGQGGLTDVNVEVISKDTVIDYTDLNSYKVFYPADWKEVNVPHDWCVEGAFVHDDALGSQPAGNGYLPTGIGFYRKEFEITKTDLGKKISIEFDGIFRNSTVWVNGHYLGNHKSGYIPSNYDLTDVLRYDDEGRNVILVKVDAREPEGWWYEGSGIYRHVWLIKTDRLHVARFGTYVTTPEVSEKVATVSIKTALENEYKNTKNITLVSKIIGNKGNVLDTEASSQIIEPNSQIEISQTGIIKKPLLWSPETPNLYKVLTEVSENGNILDTYETIFGVRTIEFNRNGFFLNSKLYPVKGTSNHQDFAGIGVALPDKINEYKIKLLKEMGGNGYRCAHHPLTPELLDICDRLGMIVLDENRFLSSSEEGTKDLTTLLLRDRNHPEYGRPEYITYFRDQIRELLTNYGQIFKIWFDGANGGTGYYGGANENRKIDRTTYYDWQPTYKMIRELQPNIVIWNDGGDRGDLRWVATEAGFVGETNWRLLNTTGEVEWAMLHFGPETGDSWVPAEVNTSIRPEWFYHPNEDTKVKTVSKLMETYYNSIGRNGTLLLNFPIMPNGLIHENDEKAALEFAAVIKASFAVNLAGKTKAEASNVRGNAKKFEAAKAIDSNKDTYWTTDDSVTKAALVIDFGEPALFNRFLVQEYIRLGQRVKSFTVEARVDGNW